MSDFGFRWNGVRSAAALVLGAGVLAAGPAACQPKQPPAPSESEMSDAKVRAVIEADSVISQGEREKADGEKLRPTDPTSADRLLKQGEDDIARGQSMKARAAAMK